MANRIVKVILRGEIGDLRGKMAAAGKSVKDTADKMTAAGKESEKFRRGLDDIGSSAGRMGLVAAAGLGAIVVASSNFESAMSSVQAATHESVANMERLRDAALEAGKETAFSATEAAAGIENLAKAGVSTNDILNGGLMGALDLAAAGTIGVAEAAEAAATAMTQFGLAGTDVPHIADLLAAGAGKAQGEVADMNQALAQAGLVANGMGLSIEETVGGLAAFGKAGLLGSDAGTSFKTMLQRLQAPIGASADEMKRLGLTAYDSQGNFIGLAEFAGQLNDKLKLMTDEQRNASLATMFGSDAVRAATEIYNQGEAGIRKWITAVDDQGFAAETAAIKMDNLKGDLEELGGSVETVLIGMGEGSQGPLRSLVQGLTKVTNAFGSMPASIQGTVTGLLGITAITGGALWFGSKVVRGVADTRVALEEMGVSADRAGQKIKRGLSGAAVLGAIGLLDTALNELFDLNIDQTNLGRSLDAWAQGNVTGEIADILGADLDRIGVTLDKVTGNGFAQLGGLNRAIAKVPFGIGNFFSGQTGSAVDNIEAVDQALAGLVDSGRGEEAARMFDELTEAALDNGSSVAQVQEAFEQYMLAVDNATPTSNTLTNSLGFLGSAWGEATSKTAAGAKAASDAAEEQEKVEQAARDARAEIRQQAEAWGGLSASVGDADTTLQEFMTSLEERATALDKFTANLNWADKVKLPKGLIQEFIDMGETGAHQLENLRNATPATRDAFVADWKRMRDEVDENDRAVADFKKRIEELNRQKLEAKRLRVEKREAERAISDFMRSLKEIPDEVVMVRIRPIVDGSVAGVDLGAVLGAPKKSADGSTVPKDGGSYADRYPYLLAPGEEVISNRSGQADRWRPLLKAINAGMLADGGTVRGYAAGGTVVQTSGMGGIDYDRLTQALLRARPVQHQWTGTFEDFQRMQASERQMSALTGAP